MAKTLNFNTIKKRYLTVTFADEKKTTIMIGTPTKAIMDDLTSLQSDLKGQDNDEIQNNDETMDELFATCARLMSRNKGGVKITKEFLEQQFDFEDIFTFFNAYMDFMNELTNLKN